MGMMITACDIQKILFFSLCILNNSEQHCKSHSHSRSNRQAFKFSLASPTISRRIFMMVIIKIAALVLILQVFIASYFRNV